MLIPSCSNNSGDEPVYPRKVSLKEAAKELGVKIPKPEYVPSEYKLTKIILNSEYIVSIFYKASETRQIEFEIDWKPKGGHPYRIDSGSPTVELDENNTGQLISRDNSNTIAWNWVPNPEPDDIPFFTFLLQATKELPVSELVKMANSVGW